MHRVEWKFQPENAKIYWSGGNCAVLQRLHQCAFSLFHRHTAKELACSNEAWLWAERQRRTVQWTAIYSEVGSLLLVGLFCFANKKSCRDKYLFILRCKARYGYLYSRGLRVYTAAAFPIYASRARTVIEKRRLATRVFNPRVARDKGFLQFHGLKCEREGLQRRCVGQIEPGGVTVRVSKCLLCDV